MRVVGVHIFTPNSSEIIQGFAMALSCENNFICSFYLLFLIGRM